MVLLSEKIILVVLTYGIIICCYFQCFLSYLFFFLQGLLVALSGMELQEKETQKD